MLCYQMKLFLPITNYSRHLSIVITTLTTRMQHINHISTTKYAFNNMNRRQQKSGWSSRKPNVKPEHEHDERGNVRGYSIWFEYQSLVY